MARSGATLLLLLSLLPAAPHTAARAQSASPADARSSPRPPAVAPDTVRVLALMVQFREDTDARTSGTGRFDLGAPAAPIIDPPPRNAAYFTGHLAFLGEYFLRASRGQTVIRSTLVNQVVTLDRFMGDYSPPRGGTNRSVADLAVDGWRAADSLGLIPDAGQYGCFIIFHAGVGRDVDLVSLLGYDPTPLDIPSLYIGPAAFREFYGPSFPGIAVNGGSVLITNTIVLPETETRVLPGVTGDVTLELGLNGLLCASVGNYLGLPDLFDTRTGRSGIGRFGLMDGQGIFSFFGVFPPEPSAWEKYWLGWIRPVTLSAGTHTVSLPATGTSDTVYRIPISEQEYYLIENRNRDPLRNGQTVTMLVNGLEVTRTFTRDTAGFSATDISALEGTIVRVEDLDWSLPGGYTQSGEFFDGGLLIWHIDERAIAAGLAGNGVNSNPARKGVRLLEADGSQDIGQQYGFLSPGSGSEDGTPLDFWYEGNRAPLYRNRFDGTTQPPAVSTGGAQTHVAMESIGPRGPVMTAVVRIGDSLITPAAGFPRRVSGRLAAPALTATPLDLTAFATGHAVLITADDGVRAWTTDGAPALAGGRSDGMLIPSLGAGPSLVTAADLNADGRMEFLRTEVSLPGRQGGVLRIFTAADAGGDSLADEVSAYEHSGLFTAVPVVGPDLIAVGADAGRAVVFTRAGVPLDSTVVTTEQPPAPITGAAALPGGRTFCFVSSAGAISVAEYPPGGVGRILAERFLGAPPAGPPAAGSFGGVWGGATRIAVATTDGRLHLLDSLLQPLPGFPRALRGPALGPPALADVNADGSRDIIVASAGAVEVLNLSGASLDHFPLEVAAPRVFTSSPVVADLDGDGAPEVIAATDDGLVLARDARGRRAPGFPLQAGTGRQSLAVWVDPLGIVPVLTIHLAVASSDTSAVSVWRTGGAAGPFRIGDPEPWPQYQGSAAHAGLTARLPEGTPAAAGFFPEQRAYNWPNPVYDGRTWIRYFLGSDAAVTVKIYDLAGDLVEELVGPGVGGVDNEVLWDVSGVQSGVYFARIQASGPGGSGAGVVKIAVVK